MKIDEYLALYSEYRKSVIDMAKMVDFVKARMRENEGETLFETEGIPDTKKLEESFERKKRILGRATGRLKRAIERMKDPNEAQYIICRYVYCMDIANISKVMMSSERQIYRLAAKAKEHLFEKLICEMPKAKRTKKSIYRRVRRGRKRRYRKYAYGNTKK